MEPQASPARPGERFARRVFRWAGIVGILELVPLYFYEPTLNRTQPPPLTHPDYYYGFLGVALAWQIAFLVISNDPARYRALLPALVPEKLLYPASAWILYAMGRVNSRLTLGVASLDLVWLALFVVAMRRLGREASGGGRP
jgi:hypothetical protein